MGRNSKPWSIAAFFASFISLLLQLPIARAQNMAVLPALCSDKSPNHFYEGLPVQLPLDYVEQNGFVSAAKINATNPFFKPLTLTPLTDHAPINYFKIQFPGTDKPASTQLQDRRAAFLEDEWASIPEGTQIRCMPGIKYKEVWEYPTDTQVVHRIYFNDHPTPKLFEFRIIKKRAAGDWAFGVYKLSDDGTSLELLTDENNAITEKPAAYPIHTRLQREVVVTVGHIGTKSCRMCHQEPEERYPCERLAGPEGFVPGNALAEVNWLENFRRQYPKRGSPFLDQRSPASAKATSKITRPKK